MTNTSTMDAGTMFNAWLDAATAWSRPWPTFGIAAPQQLTQSILPGWSLISVNETNSKSPETERAVVSKVSYGRQLGRLMDAVEALIDGRPDAESNEAFKGLRTLADVIEAAKTEAAEQRIAGMIADLDTLRETNEQEFLKQRDALLAYFASG